MTTARRLTLLIFIALFVLSSNGLARTQKRPARSRDTHRGLRLSIQFDKASYRLGEIADIKVVLTNVSSLPITIYKKMGWGCLGSLGYLITDSQGRGLMPLLIRGSFFGPPFLRKDFVTLKPGQSLQDQSGMAIDRQEGFKRPGSYRITVWYHSPVSQELAPQGLQTWSRENGDLTVGPVSFAVTR